MTNEKESARAQLRKWLRDYIEGKDEVHTPTLTNDAIAHFEGNRKFMGQLATEMLRPAIYEEAQKVVGESRTFTVVGDQALTREAIEERAERFANRFLNWYEHTGERHVRVMDATREDLLSAAALRRDRGNHELRIAALWEQLARGLEGGQRVSERFSAEEIDALYRRIAGAQEGVA